MRDVEAIATDVVDCAIHIHRDLGPGLLESVYELVLAASLQRRGYTVDRQRPVNIVYDGMSFDSAFRLDLIVNDCFIVEIKSVESLLPVHAKQVLTYLRLMNLPLGLLLNFSGPTMKSGIRRLVNNYRPNT